MRITARLDSRLAATIVEVRALHMPGGADEIEDRPAHVRAASGLTQIAGGLAVIQDDASFVVLLDDALEPYSAIALPRGIGGHRQFDDGRGNKRHKPDFESCITVPGAHGPALLLFGSGSTEARQQIARISLLDSPAPVVQVYDASPLYAALRNLREFAGSELNIEGSVCDVSHVRLFNRGNGASRDGLEPVNASVDLGVESLLAWLDGGAVGPSPALGAVMAFELGAIDGCPLGFTDATQYGGAVLYSAVAEMSPDVTRDGPVLGAVIGVIRGGAADYTMLRTSHGEPYAGKVEGICLVGDHLVMVVDGDDPAIPSELALARLGGPWL